MDEQTTGFHAFKRSAPVETFASDFARYVASFGDVYFWPLGKFYVVTRAELAMQALRDPALSADRSSFFVSRMPNMNLGLIQDFFGVVAKMMVMSDGQDHKERRAVAAKAFTSSLTHAYAQEIPAKVDDLIDRGLRGGELDFARDVAAVLPSMILADLFDIPAADRALFYERSGAMTGFFGGGTGYEDADGVRVNDAAIGLREYFRALLEERRAHPAADFFSRMIQASTRFGLDDMAIISQAIMMLVAGQVTTSDQMSNNLFELLRHPSLLVEARAAPEIIPVLTEELTRLDPAVTFMFRVAKTETKVGAQSIAAGGVVFISTHAINRDPTMFADPDRINLGRGDAKHFSYGFGAHHCLGAQLARVEINAVFRRLLERFKRIEWGSSSPVRDHYSLSFSGFKTLPIRVVP